MENVQEMGCPGIDSVSKKHLRAFYIHAHNALHRMKLLTQQSRGKQSGIKLVDTSRASAPRQQPPQYDFILMLYLSICVSSSSTQCTACAHTRNCKHCSAGETFVDIGK